MRGDNITFRTFDTVLLQAGLAAGLAILMAGCQQKYWYQEGKTFDECKADHEDCWTELLKRTDLRYASSYKDRFLGDYMQRRGYWPISEEDLPLDVKREDPGVPSDVPWIRSYGVAGTLSMASIGPAELRPRRIRDAGVPQSAGSVTEPLTTFSW